MVKHFAPRPCPVIEILESRQLLSASLHHHGQLKIDGTRHADTIAIALDSDDSSKLDVTINGVIQVFDLSDVQTLKIDTHGGADILNLDPALTLSTSVAGQPKADGQDDEKKPPAPKPAPAHAISGIVTFIDSDAGRITVSMPGAHGVTTQSTFTVTSATTITADGHPATLGSLNITTSVLLQTSSTDPRVAVSIQAMNPHVMGTIVSVDAANRIIRVRTAPNHMAFFSVNGNATVTLNGASGELSAIAADTKVSLTLSVFNNSDVIAISGTVAKTPAKPAKLKKKED